MGANEHAVVIANEGLHSRSPAPRDPALTGMDLVRLGLERASTAAEAVEVITKLLEQYGQGGNCGYHTATYYQNGFILADALEAYVLETVGREWAVERVEGVRTLSNEYSIGRSPARVSRGLQRLINESRADRATTLTFAELIGDPAREHIGQAGARRKRSATLLRSDEGRVGAASLFAALRDHGGGESSCWHPNRSSSYSICMHAGTEDRFGQTTASWVSELRLGAAVHWVTGTAAPCISIYKPLLLGLPMPSHGPRPTAHFDPESLWWRHERLHRRALMADFSGFLEQIRQERDELEAAFRSRVLSALDDGSGVEQTRVIEECWKQAINAEDRWSAQLSKPTMRVDKRYLAAWTQESEAAGLELG